MPQSHAHRAGPVPMRSEDIRDIRRHLQNLEFQVQQLRQEIDLNPGEATHSIAAASPVSYRLVREMIDARRTRDRHFGDSLFGEPAWDILLALYAAELAQMRVTTSQLCLGAAVPATTALRWIGNLDEAGLLERRNDPFDGRRVFVNLTDKARETFRSYFEELLGTER